MEDVSREPKGKGATCGERLRAARLSRGLRAGAAADRAGVPRSSWSDYEAGSVPRADIALKVVAALGVTVEEIWGDASLPAAAANETPRENDEPTGPVVVREGYDQRASVGG